MKTKIFILALMISGALSTQAQTPYQHSIGGILGFMEGASYKTFINANLAAEVDLGFRVSYIAGLDVNGNLMYEKAIKNGFYWFAGGGISIGPAFYNNYYNNHYVQYNGTGFKFGLNAIGGVEYKFNSIPLTLQADLRPGSAFFIWPSNFFARFDYNFLNLSARYILR